jgi:hypothetical protein
MEGKNNMSAQTSYSYQTPKGVAGSLFDLAPYSIDSRINGETDPGKLKFGMGAVQGTVPGSDVKVPTGADTAAKFEGVVLTGFTNEMNREGDVVIFPGQTVGVLRYGKPWARIADGITVAYGDPLYLITDGADAGLFSNVSTDAIAVQGRFIGTSGSGNIAPVEIFNQSNA